MSVLTISFAQSRMIKFFTAVLFAATFLLFPLSVSADTLPLGVVERSVCGEFIVDIRGYGSGMMHSTEPVGTSNQRVSYISPTNNCAVVQWQSTAPSATQVLFAELTNEPVTISTAEANFGYPHASTQNNAGIANHTAILEGLEPGKAYSYRLVTRSHPTAIPTISDPRVLIAGPSVVQPVVVTSPPVIVLPTPVTPPAPLFDAEKFPVSTPGGTEKESVVVVPEQEATTTVPAAIVAAGNAIKDVSREKSLWAGIQRFFSKLKPDGDRLNLSSNIGLFEKDRYIIPTLFFLGLLFLLQQLVLPAFSVNLKNPTLYWIFGSVVLTVVSAVFMFYYITLVGIALFLGLLAWYLIKNVPEEETTPGQPKLIDEKSTSRKERQEQKKSSKN